MSTQALGWVLDHSPEEGAERLVLIAIANHADKEPNDDAWQGWPGIATIQREARLRRGRTVQDVLTRLIKSGAIERELNGGGDRKTRSDRRPNLYRIIMDHGVTCHDTRCRWCGVPRDASRGDASRPDGVPSDDPTGCRETAPEPKEEPSYKPTEEPRGSSGSLFDDEPRRLNGKVDPLEGFDEWYAVYPRHEARGAAEKAWPTALRRAGSLQVLIDGAKRYRDKPGRTMKWTAHPATWLNEVRWEDAHEEAEPERPPQPNPDAVWSEISNAWVS